MGHLIYTDLFHAIFHLILDVFVPLLLLEVRIVLVLSFHLVGVFDPHKAYDLIFIAFEFLLHVSAMVQVCIICSIDLLFYVSDALCLLWGILIFLDNLKLRCGWLFDLVN